MDSGKCSSGVCGRISCRLLCCSGWGEDIDTDCLKIFSSYFSRVNGQMVWWSGIFFPISNCGVVTMEILLIFPVPDGYIIFLIARIPFKQKSKAKGTVLWWGMSDRALICVVSPAEGRLLFEACS